MSQKQHRRDPGPQFDENVRRILRERRGDVAFQVALTEREKDVRLNLPKMVWEIYDEIPDTTDARYLPDEHKFVLDLPEPQERTKLSDFSIDD